MLKGAQKRMIVIRTRNSRLFEEAYFVMRRDLPESTRHGSDMLGEANRIIERSLGVTAPDAEIEASSAPHPLARRILHLLPPFLVGLLGGTALAGGLFLWL